MVEPANGSSPDGLRPEGELLHLDQPPQGSSAAHGQATGVGLAGAIGSHSSTEPPPGFGDLPAFGIKVLLDNPGERIRHRCHVQESQTPDSNFSGAGASRDHQLLQCRRYAFSGPSGGGSWESAWEL